MLSVLSYTLSIPLVYNIVLPYFRHFGSFVPKIGEFRKKFGIYSMRKWLYYNHFRMGVFFFEKSFRVPRIVPKVSDQWHLFSFTKHAFNKPNYLPSKLPHLHRCNELLLLRHCCSNPHLTLFLPIAL